MVNIWAYVNAKKVTITTLDDEAFSGKVISVMDTDENGEDEDDITIDVNGRYISFLPSEIKRIESLKVL